jgi:internalin A
MTYQAAVQKIEQAAAEQWEELDLSGMNLTELPPEIGQLGQLKRLILGEFDWEKMEIVGNQLTELPQELWQLQQLEEINLSENQISAIPDAIAQLSNLQSLKLSSNQISVIPDTIAQLGNLQYLDLSSNQISVIPNAIAQLGNLQYLKLRSNQISVIPDAIAQLENLRYLDLWENQISVIPNAIAQLENLQSLRLSYNQINIIPDAIAQLENLQSLNLSYNQISVIPDMIARLENLQSLDLSDNQINAIPGAIAQLENLQSLRLSYNQINVIPDEIAQLENLQSLNLSYNQINVIPDAIAQLESLQSLNLSYNQINVILDAIAQLENLQSLILSRNQISVIPDAIARLENLQSLILIRNQISVIPDAIAQLANLKGLNLANNKIQGLPAAIETCPALEELDLRGNPIPIPNLILDSEGFFRKPGDLQTILKFYFQTQDPNDREPLYEAKLLIVGEGEAGKTTLAEKLQNLDFEVEPGRPSTEGIDVIRWEFNQPDSNPFRTNIWDFGGQAIYHQTHQFFLTERSLYLLVVDDRRENPNFYYWLNVIRVLTDNSPVLVIQNEKNNNKCNTNEGELRKEFSNLEKFFPLNLACDKDKLETLQQHIQQRITQLPQVREPWPKSWVRIRHVLENYAQNQNYISLEEYKTLCRTNGITDSAEMLQISKALHELGICLHFQQDILKHQIILKPEWVTNAIYKVVKNDEIVANNGCFTRDNLKALWRDRQYAEVQDELLALMQKFNLCYPLIGLSGSYIAPQILPIEPPDYSHIDFTDSLTLTYRYEFMPKGLIAPFIVGMYRLIAQGQRLVWRNGVILTDGNAQAEIIELYNKREIQIRVTGFQKRSLLDRIRQKIWEIHASYDDRLKYEELIPCNCKGCLTQPIEARETYDLATLMERIRRGKKMTVDCTKSDEDVNIRQLIDDFPNVDPTARSEFSPEGSYEDMREIAKLAVSRPIQVKQEQNMTNQSPNTTNLDLRQATVGAIATDNAQTTVSNNTFSQVNNTSTEDLLKLITNLRQSAASFPTDTREEIETDLEDLEAEITKPPADRNLTRIKKRLIAIFTAATLLAGGVSGATDFANTAIDLGQKFDIDIPALVGH